MVLIISDSDDNTTDTVIEWLCSMNVKYQRINSGDVLENIHITENNIIFTVNGTDINTDDIKSFWLRRGNFSYSKLFDIESLHIQQQQHLHNEWKSINEYILYKLQQIKGISNLSKSINKLIVLDKAKAKGLLIPPFHVSDFKTSLYKETIIKAISDAYHISQENSHTTFYTQSIDEIKYDSFFATFFQAKINPKYEIRSIFIKGKCWSMAIHNPSKDVDYRKNYSELRYSPYQLPVSIEAKTWDLLQELNLEFGAIDFIVDRDDNHYFLEINPVGQFGMVSIPCNYFIEREIAKMLVS